MQHERPRIVAIDDDAANLRLVEMILSPSYDVTTFDRPTEALAALQTGEAPDLIVCDVTMPGIDGFELHEELRKVPTVRGVPFLFLTALADRDNMRRGMSQGADDYVTKPFTGPDLRAAVAIRLDRAAGLRQGASSEGLRVRSLGGVEMTVAGERLQWEAKRVVEAMLFFVERGAGATLDELRRELYWDHPSKNNLHVLLSRLRKTLTGIADVATSDDAIEVRLSVPVAWDALAFERAARAALGDGRGDLEREPEAQEATAAGAEADATGAAAIEQAIAGYAGTFLPGFASPWAERMRGRLEELYVALLEAAVDVADTEAAAERARGRLERFLGFDPGDA